MDLVGEFHKVEISEKPYLVYLNVKHPLPQIDSLNSSTKAAIDDSLRSSTTSFLCPSWRYQTTLSLRDETSETIGYEIFIKLETSPLFDGRHGHHVLPLSWCNNKEADPDFQCYGCGVQNVNTDYYYFCVECDRRFHKECVESPLEITYPSHVKHSLQLYLSQFKSDDCILCKKEARGMVYYCSLCDIYMHVVCAQATIPFFIDQPKRHHHTLTLFPRQASLTCNVCGLVNKHHLTYVCSICDFVAHNDCIYIPQTIRISRHNHRISFISSLPSEKLSCGVCRREVDSDYGAYTCNVCCGYVVHTRCALRNDIWDGIELEGVPEEFDIYQDVEPFERIADGIILHFSHGHHLRIEFSKVYDKNKFCQACVLPIYEGSFYSCMECNFILHETCANAPRKKLHPLHPHPVNLEVFPVDDCFVCYVCTRYSNGLVYKCAKRDCVAYQIDLRCAEILEPFEYQGHKHPLFLALEPKERPMCHVCKSWDDHQVLNCIECDFIICFKCATLPYMVRYKHDEHFLIFCHGDEVNDSDWCELCEGKLEIGGTGGFYKCNDCCTTLHVNCLLGREPYLKHGQTFTIKANCEMHITRNSSQSRPICVSCQNRCVYPIFLAHEQEVCCSIKCMVKQYY